MTKTLTLATGAALLYACSASAQTTADPFPTPIPAADGSITVNVVEFATLPDFDGQPARMMLMVREPGTGHLFVSDMNGLLLGLTDDGQTVTTYLDLNEPRWDVPVQRSGNEQGFQSFAFHPQFSQSGEPGFGKFYTYVDTSNKTPVPDFTSSGGDDTHDTVLLEWTAATPGAETYDGGPSRELMRFEQPFRNHNAGQLAFNPLASPGDTDFGLLYMGSADGGSGGDPLGTGQNLAVAFGKILRIDPLGSNSANGEYGIPADNPYANDGRDDTVDEIYASGVRNPQRFDWDRQNGNLYVADIGQGIIEEISLVTRGANLGWNTWEGSFRFIGRREVSLTDPRGESGFTYPIAEWGHRDPLMLRRGSGPLSRAAVTGVVVYRQDEVPQLTNRLIFGDNPSGEVFFVDADDLPEGGQDPIRRILFRYDGETQTLLQLIHAKNADRGQDQASRAALRFGTGFDGQVFLLNKGDGVVRLLAP